MSKHTPAPWVGKNQEGRYCNTHKWNAPDHETHNFSTAAPIVDSKGKLIAYVCSSSNRSWNEHDSTVDANARLIAAAPDLLEALGEFLRNPGGDYTEEIARTAIAKATGESE